MSSESWRAAIAEQNARLGIKPSPPPATPLPPKKPVGHVERLEERESIAAGLGARPRHVAGEMNGTEKRYAAYLETRRICGEIADWKFEAIKLKLARATFYNPDFMVVRKDGRLELHEVKGFAEDDWRVKHKIAIEMFPEFGFVIVCWNKNKKGWDFRNVAHREEAE
jgi:hypothetical protein